jgi:hypothetical protein
MINAYVKRIVEAAVQPSRALSEGLALCFSQPLDIIILYKPSVFGNPDEGLLKTSHKGVIFGYLSYRDRSVDNYHIREVTASAATHGYGPILYDTLLHSGWAIPDRGSVSKAALRVWEYYAKSRPETVIKKIPDPLRDTSDNLQFDERKNHLLNSMYSLPNIDQRYDDLLVEHEKFVESMRRYRQQIVIEKKLDDLGQDFFAEKYSG